MRTWLVALGVLAALGAIPAQAKTQADAAAIRLPADPLGTVVRHADWVNVAEPLVPDDLHGRVVLLNFWRFGCADCLSEMEGIAQLEKIYGTQLVVVGIHSWQFKEELSDEAISHAMVANGVQHPVANDANQAIAKAFRVTQWPTQILLNPRGGIEAVYAGEGHFDEMQAAIQRMAKLYSGHLRHDPVKLRGDNTVYTLLDYPGGIAYLPMYRNAPALAVADTGHDRVVVSDLQGKVLEVIGSGAQGHSDGIFEDARFSRPEGVAVHGELVYIADTGNHLLRLANLSTRKVVTLAGTGALAAGPLKETQPAAKSMLASPWALALWPDENHVAIAMAGNNQLWSYNVADKTVSLLAGSGDKGQQDGPAASAKLAQPSGLAALGNRLFFTDAQTSTLRVLEKGQVKTLAGDAAGTAGYKTGPKGGGLMQHPMGLAAVGDMVFIADSYNHAIRAFDLKKGLLENLAGGGESGKANGAGSKASFSQPQGLAAQGGSLFVADTDNSAVRVVEVQGQKVSPLAVHEEAQKEPVALQEALPNVTETDPIRLAMQSPVRLNLKLKPGWHIHQEGPSYLALFDLVKNNQVVVSFDRGMLLQNRMLIPPRLGMQYKLQGTFFYCEDSKQSVCEVQSIDAPVSFEDGQEKQHMIDLSKP